MGNDHYGFCQIALVMPMYLIASIIQIIGAFDERASV